MAVYKEEKTNTWKVYYRYTDWKGERKQTTKRGFATKREALAWEREQLNKTQADLDMTFASFVETYTADMKSRIKENTWHTKDHILRTKILPYFGKRKISEIQAKDIIAWQNEMLKGKDKNGKPYSPVYLKTLHNQLSAVFNHAVKYYGLHENPAAKVGNMGKARSRERRLQKMFFVRDKIMRALRRVVQRADLRGPFLPVAPGRCLSSRRRQVRKIAESPCAESSPDISVIRSFRLFHRRQESL
jgi:hypothetical protein